MCDRALFSQKIAKIEQKVKGRGDTALYFRYLASPISFDLGHFRGKRGVKVGPKVQTLCTSRFHKNLNFSEIFQTHFLPRCVLPLVKTSSELDNFSGGRSQNPYIKVDKTFNFGKKLWRNS